ncbi:MAG: hypothetical protein H6936_11705 [Burkholderiales bacterium]|nr:hypothetical protein [Burkholderiales bacterium]
MHPVRHSCQHGSNVFNTGKELLLNNVQALAHHDREILVFQCFTESLFGLQDFALALKQADADFIGRMFSVTTKRTAMEFRGISILQLDETTSGRQQIK